LVRQFVGSQPSHCLAVSLDKADLQIPGNGDATAVATPTPVAAPAAAAPAAVEPAPAAVPAAAAAAPAAAAAAPAAAGGLADLGIASDSSLGECLVLGVGCC